MPSFLSPYLPLTAPLASSPPTSILLPPRTPSTLTAVSHAEDAPSSSSKDGGVIKKGNGSTSAASVAPAGAAAGGNQQLTALSSKSDRRLSLTGVPTTAPSANGTKNATGTNGTALGASAVVGVDTSSNPGKRRRLSQAATPSAIAKQIQEENAQVLQDPNNDPNMPTCLGGKSKALPVEWVSMSRPGNDPMKRAKENQDACVVKESFTGDERVMFFGVFDGHGPLGGGASHFVRERLPQALAEAKESLIKG